MFDVLADQTDPNSSMVNADFRAETGPAVGHTNVDMPTFRTIHVLLVDTLGNAEGTAIIEQCLRYMARFECLITQAGSTVAAEFALQAESFDLLVTDEHSFDLVAAHIDVPTIIVARGPNSKTTRNALIAGALHCLPLIDLSPRLLETAIDQMLSDEP
jgi:hypothetical protein